MSQRINKMRIRRWLCLIAGLAVFFHVLSCDSVKGRRLPVSGGVGVIDIDSLEDKVPVFYYVDLDKSRVVFFVIKIDGVVKSYLDACENCYRFKKGYTLKGNDMICNYCGSRYPLVSLETGIAGCHPMPLEGSVEGRQYLISLAEIEKAGRFF